MRKQPTLIRLTLLVAAVSALPLSVSGAEQAAVGDDHEIWKVLPAQTRGVCVILDPPDIDILESLGRSENFLVHALLSDTAKTTVWRKKMRGHRWAGLVSIDSWDGRTLPHIDNLLDAVIIFADGKAPGKSQAQDMVRALAPHGVALIKSGGQQADIENIFKDAGAEGLPVDAQTHWRVFKKLRPADMDDWTHYRHGPDGNPVSKDRIVASPNRLQWIAGPSWNTGRHRSSPVETSPNGLLSAQGRNYYVHGSHLVVRSSFNGTLCWTRKINGLNVRKLVVSGDRVFVTLDGHLVALDGATGELKHTYLKDQKIATFFLDADTLFVKANDGLHAFDVTTGAPRWSNANRASLLLASEGRLIVSPQRNQCAALNQADGKEIWLRDLPAKTQIVLASHGFVLTRSGHRFTALDAATGKNLWNAASNKGDALVFVAGGLVWIETNSKTSDHGHPAIKSNAETISKFLGHDPRTGKGVRSISTPPSVKFRCHPLYATDRFMVGNRPIYFTSWEDGKSFCFEGTRAECGSAYGLGQGLFFGLYGNSAKCMCMSTAISGTTAFASDENQFIGEVPDAPEPQLVKGPAALPDPVLAATDAWPMYRHNALRSATTQGQGSAEWQVAWRQKTLEPIDAQETAHTDALLMKDWRVCKPSGDMLTAPTIAAGKVYVAMRNLHQVIALDAATGKVLWRVDTAARVDAPPTYYKGLCLFGGHDGWVYALRADDGSEVWRYRAAPAERRMVSYGQLTSSWPIIGGVLLQNDTAYVIAGLSTENDGGLYVHALNPLTGEPRWSGRRRKTSEELFGGYTPRRGTTYVGSVDLLCSDGQTVSIAGCARGRFDAKTGEDFRYFKKGHALGWIPTRYYRDQYGTCTPPAAWLGTAHIGCRRQELVKAGANGWKVKLTLPQRVEGLVALTGAGASKKASALYARPAARAVKTAVDIQIDGIEDEAYAKAGEPVALRHLNGRTQAPKFATTARMLSDDKNLYVFVRCETPTPEKVIRKKTKRDDGVWQDECVELFIDPTGKRKQSYYHLIVNAAGITEDAWDKDHAWNPNLTVKCGVLPGEAWTVEIKLPFAELNAHGDGVQNEWAFNINRSARAPNKPSQVEDTAWSPTFDTSSHVPNLFGHLWLDALHANAGEAAFLTFQKGLRSIPHPGQAAAQGIDMAQATVLAAVSFNRPGLGGELQVLSAQEGKLLNKVSLPAAPTYDGMAFAQGHIFITLQDGSVVCLKAK